MNSNVTLSVVIPFLPPSSNHIYVNARGGKGRFLSKEAKKFKLDTISYIQTHYLPQISNLDREGLYRVWYIFYFLPEDILNTTYGNGLKNSAKTRYKKLDVENRLKLVSDALATAIGIDDCQFFEGGHSKMSASLNSGFPQLHIFLSLENPTRFGIK